MALDKELRQLIDSDITSWVRVGKRISKDVGDNRAMWRYDNAFDFMYGQIIGMIRGSAWVMFKVAYKRLPNKYEQIEINSIIIGRAREIRQAIEQLKDQPK